MIYNVFGIKKRRFIMNYIDQIFSRTNIEQLTSFILYGVECTPDPRPYIDRLKDAQEKMSESLKEQYPDRYDNLLDIAHCYAATVEDIYTEIGIRVGFTLAKDLLGK